MKKLYSSILFIIVASTSLVYADAPNKPISNGKDDCQHRDPHCAYADFDVEPVKPTVGKYIKITYPKDDNWYMVRCMTKMSIQYDLDDIYRDRINGGSMKPGDELFVQYEQCNDRTCTRTNGIVQNDRYQVLQIDEYTFMTQPNRFAIHIDHNFGEDCETKIPMAKN